MKELFLCIRGLSLALPDQDQRAHELFFLKETDYVFLHPPALLLFKVFYIISSNFQAFTLVWWLILCVNLIGLRDLQIAGKTLFLGVYEGVSGID